MSAGRGRTPDRSRYPHLTAGPMRGASCEDAPREHMHRHRESVVRRLLARGVSANTLTALLPELRPVIQRVVRKG